MLENIANLCLILQEALQRLGFYSGEEDMEYSSFSSGTERAVKTWQVSGLLVYETQSCENFKAIFGEYFICFNMAESLALLCLLLRLSWRLTLQGSLL